MYSLDSKEVFFDYVMFIWRCICDPGGLQAYWGVARAQVVSCEFCQSFRITIRAEHFQTTHILPLYSWCDSFQVSCNLKSFITNNYLSKVCPAHLCIKCFINLIDPLMITIHQNITKFEITVKFAMGMSQIKRLRVMLYLDLGGFVT